MYAPGGSCRSRSALLAAATDADTYGKGNPVDHLTCIEVQVREKTGDVVVTVSIPGREGTLSRVWSGRDGCHRLSVPQMEDIKAWVAQTVENHVLARSGVQGLLEGL